MKEDRYMRKSGFLLVKKYQRVKVKPLLVRRQTCLITLAKRFMRMNHLGYFSNCMGAKVT